MSTLLKLHVELPGTGYRGDNGELSPSTAGHAWMEIVHPDGTSVQGGFAPDSSKEGMSAVPGEVSQDDGNAYDGEPRFTATYEITEEQGKSLKDFFQDPASGGFDKDKYHAFYNSCVDFVWKGLEKIGMNPSGWQGAILPEGNIDPLSQLKNPDIPGDSLRKVEFVDNKTDILEAFRDCPRDFWWSRPPTSWAPNFCFGDDLPTGTITISPLGPEVYPVTDVGFGFYGERVDLSMDLFQSSEAFWSSMGRRYGEIGF